MNPKRKIIQLVVMAAMVAAVGVGCSSTKPNPVQWSLSIHKATKASVPVDIIGVSPAEKAHWEGVSPDEYWKGYPASVSVIRRDAKKVAVDFGAGDAWMLDRKDPKWDEWLGYGSTELLIMSNLPGASPKNDWRRFFLSLDKKVHPNAKKKTLRIEIQDASVHVLD